MLLLSQVQADKTWKLQRKKDSVLSDIWGFRAELYRNRTTGQPTYFFHHFLFADIRYGRIDVNEKSHCCSWNSQLRFESNNYPNAVWYCTKISVSLTVSGIDLSARGPSRSTVLSSLPQSNGTGAKGVVMHTDFIIVLRLMAHCNVSW